MFISANTFVYLHIFFLQYLTMLLKKKKTFKYQIYIMNPEAIKKIKSENNCADQ